jgi:hypothetical protein
MIRSFDKPDRDIVARLEVGMAVSRLRLAQRYPKRRDQPMLATAGLAFGIGSKRA